MWKWEKTQAILPQPVWPFPSFSGLHKLGDYACAWGLEYKMRWFFKAHRVTVTVTKSSRDQYLNNCLSYYLECFQINSPWSGSYRLQMPSSTFPNPPPSYISRDRENVTSRGLAHIPHGPGNRRDSPSHLLPVKPWGWPRLPVSCPCCASPSFLQTEAGRKTACSKAKSPSAV